MRLILLWVVLFVEAISVSCGNYVPGFDIRLPKKTSVGNARMANLAGQTPSLKKKDGFDVSASSGPKLHSFTAGGWKRKSGNIYRQRPSDSDPKVVISVDDVMGSLLGPVTECDSRCHCDSPVVLLIGKNTSSDGNSMRRKGWSGPIVEVMGSYVLWSTKESRLEQRLTALQPILTALGGYHIVGIAVPSIGKGSNSVRDQGASNNSRLESVYLPIAKRLMGNINNTFVILSVSSGNGPRRTNGGTGSATSVEAYQFTSRVLQEEDLVLSVQDLVPLRMWAPVVAPTHPPVHELLHCYPSVIAPSSPTTAISRYRYIDQCVTHLVAWMSHSDQESSTQDRMLADVMSRWHDVELLMAIRDVIDLPTVLRCCQDLRDIYRARMRPKGVTRSRDKYKWKGSMVHWKRLTSTLVTLMHTHDTAGDGDQAN